jgi:uncharacterized protein (DUF1501 family)
MTTTAGCCEEFERAARVSRRRFLQGAALAGGAAVATSVFGDAVRQAAVAATPGAHTLVVLSLRGGIDGMGLVVPHGDPGYYKARPRIAVQPDALLQRDGMFGLHPKLGPLEWLFESNELAAVHAVGLPVPNRSHFSAMEEIEDADPLSAERRGWVNRMIGLDGDGDPTDAVHLSSSMAPTIIDGPSPTLAASELSSLALVGARATDDQGWRDRRVAQLHDVWDSVPGPLGNAGRSTLATNAVLDGIASAPYTPANGVTYPAVRPAADLGRALQDTAQLIRANIGTEVVSIDYGSWDMHSDYGTVGGGEMQSMTNGLALCLDAFLKDLGELRSKVTVVTISEFGRRLAENGNQGLDHGWGNVMLVAGGGVKGGYYANWPGLTDGDTVAGDLAVTTDYRDVLGEIVQKQLGRSAGAVFPGYSPKPLGLFAA